MSGTTRAPPPTTTTPTARPDVVFRSLGRKWVLYDPSSRRLHVLNLTGALLWALCDGTHDVDAMVRAVRGNVADAPDEARVRADVLQTLTRFRDEGLLR